MSTRRCPFTTNSFVSFSLGLHLGETKSSYRNLCHEKSSIQGNGVASRNEKVCLRQVSRRWLVGSRARLGGDQRLLLALDGRLLVSLELVGRSSGEVRVSNSGLRAHLGRGRSATEHRLGLGGVVTHVLLGQLSGMGSVLASDLAELVGLGIKDVGRLPQLLVDELLVRGVDQRHSEEGGGSNQSKTPVWDDLDEPVGKEGADTDLNG